MRRAGDALDRCRRRVQQETHGHRGRTGDPLHAAGRVLHAGADLLTGKQHERLTALFTANAHAGVEAARDTDQRMIRASRDPDAARGRVTMTTLTEFLAAGAPAALTEFVILTRCLEHLRGTARAPAT